MEDINLIYKIAPFAFGITIGWIVFYFIRLYKEYNVYNLIKTVSVFIGGAGFCSLSFIAGATIGSISTMYYLSGCAIGCFSHFLYQLIISFCFQNKFCRTWDQYILLSSCNIPIEDRAEIRRNGINAARLEKCYKQLTNGRIDENDFAEYIKSCPITKSEYGKMCQVDEMYFILSDEVITYINAKGLEAYFKD